MRTGENQRDRCGDQTAAPDGVGIKRAEAIVDFREIYGDFWPETYLLKV